MYHPHYASQIMFEQGYVYEWHMYMYGWNVCMLEYMAHRKKLLRDRWNSDFVEKRGFGD